jgi:hypothetical protein
MKDNERNAAFVRLLVRTARCRRGERRFGCRRFLRPLQPFLCHHGLSGRSRFPVHFGESEAMQELINSFVRRGRAHLDEQAY